VDVTSLAVAGCRPVIVVVVSHVTKSRDVVRMVLQKIGMDAEHADQLIQLVAIVNYRPPHTTSNSVQFDGR